jgi:F0F1-type ATP synthase assembly protein I
MKKSLIFSLSFIGSIGFATAVPLVVFALIGRYLDKFFNTSPYLLLLGIAIATVIIFFILKQIIKDASEKIKKIND